MGRGKNSRWLVLTQIGLQMGLTVYLLARLGKYLDSQAGNTSKQWFTISLTIFGVVISMYAVLRQVNKLNDEDDGANTGD